MACIQAPEEIEDPAYHPTGFEYDAGQAVN